MPTTPELRRGLVELSAAMLLSGTIGYFVLASTQPIWNVVFFRCLLGCVGLALYGAWRGLWTPWPFSRAALAWCLAGGVALVGNWLLLFNAYRYASIGLATALYHTQPFLLMLLGATFLGETLNRRHWLGLALAFSGLLLLVLPGLDASGDGALLGSLLALGAALLYAVATLIAKRLPPGLPPALTASLQTGVGVLLLWPLVDADAAWHAGSHWLELTVLGLVHTCLMYVLMYAAFRRLPTHLIGALGFIYPVTAILVDWLAFDHRLGPAQWLGLVLILGANLWLVRGARPAPATSLAEQR
ncbi:DMT family transporter [Crenobacter sp. SG2305]|uniref:DMT family transporter n=1 Tax=Crenobacter oryzisoli TaxID=3056844 RepID=UPI0025AA4D5E|nr:DMT family transporter [Crenobacter sp. SG2305]MDN0083815.1 DMT family transporter [Crenobacter sp. SG2305]